MTRIGIDLGNSGCKVAAFDENGGVLALARRAIVLESGKHGERELDPAAVRDAVLDALAEVCRDGRGADVDSIAISSQGEAIVPLDREGKPIAKVQASFDSRSAEAVAWAYATLDGGRLESITGNPRHAMFSLYKLLTIRRNQPDVYARLAKVASFGDWIAAELCGELAMDFSLASRTSMLDIHTRTWSSYVTDALELDPRLLPALVPSGTPIAAIRPELADRLGISRRAVVASGAHDQIACSIGAGITAPGQAMNSMGTTDTVLVLSSHADQIRDIVAGGNAIGLGAMEGFVLHGYVMSTGSTTAWFDQTFVRGELALDELAELAWQGGAPSGLHFLPHMAGSGTPHLDALSTGMFSGLTIESGLPQMYRAVLEGISFELKENLDRLERAGGEVSTVTTIGGASRSDVYLQLKADIFGRPVQRSRTAEAGCYGAAVLAGLGQGHQSIAEAAAAAAAGARVFEPDPIRHEAYSELEREHKRLYEASQLISRTT